MFEMTQGLRHNKEGRAKSKFPCNARGFSMLELVLVLSLTMVLTVMAIPQVQSGLNNYRLSGAVAMTKWSIQSTRFQALMKGYPFQVAFDATTNKYQIQELKPPSASYTNVDSAVPVSGSPITINQNTTLRFSPNGTVTAQVGTNVFTITYQGTCKQITVSNYGSVAIALCP